MTDDLKPTKVIVRIKGKNMEEQKKDKPELWGYAVFISLGSVVLGGFFGTMALTLGIVGGAFLLMAIYRDRKSPPLDEKK